MCMEILFWLVPRPLDYRLTEHFHQCTTILSGSKKRTINRVHWLNDKPLGEGRLNDLRRPTDMTRMSKQSNFMHLSIAVHPWQQMDRILVRLLKGGNKILHSEWIIHHRGPVTFISSGNRESPHRQVALIWKQKQTLTFLKTNCQGKL